MNDSAYEDVLLGMSNDGCRCLCVCVCVRVCAGGGAGIGAGGCLTMVLIISMIYEHVWCHSAIREAAPLCSPHLVSSPLARVDAPKIIVR